MFRAWLLCLLLLPVPAFAEAEAPGPAARPTASEKRIRLVWTETPPAIDGVLDDAVWKQATRVDDFTQTFPYVGTQPSQRTEVLLLTDGHTLFVAFRAWDTEVEKVVKRRMLRDTVDMFWDDRVNLVLDTFHDHRNGYFFQMNAVGARRDGTTSGPIEFENNWDGIWEGKASIDAEGWSVEWAIPFQTLNFDPQLDAWGINFERGIRRNNEEMRWADPDQRRLLTNVSHAGVITGLHGIQQGLGLDVVPTGSLRRVDDNLQDRHYWSYDPSLDAFYKLLPSLTASATVHTDFGETEVDDVQVNLNRFALFFPEKRDFFLQDESIFRFGGLADNGRPFFSRNIGQACFPGYSPVIENGYCPRNIGGPRGLGIVPDGDPVDILGGAKLTGRIGNWNIGVLDTQIDDRSGLDPRPGSAIQQQLETRPHLEGRNLSVARISYNLLEESRIGVIATHGNPYSNQDNSLAGVDFNYRDSDVWNGNAVEARSWLQRSFTEGVDGGDEWAWGTSLSYPNDLVSWSLGVFELQDDFFPALGFLNRPGIRQYDADYRYRIRPHDSPVRTLDTRVLGRLVTDNGTEIQTGAVSFRPIKVESHHADAIEVRYEHRYENLDNAFAIKGDNLISAGSYHYDEAFALLETSKSRNLRADLEAGGGSFYDGTRARVRPRLEWRPSKYWFASLEYDHNELWSIGAQAERFRFRVARVRLNLQLTPDLSWITIVQYDNVSDSVGLQSRIRWIVTEGREIFLVFNQGLDTRDGDIDVARTEPLAKVGWTFRF